MIERKKIRHFYMAPHAFYFWIVNQLPAVMSPRKVTVVVSPLLALIKDQMDQLQVVLTFTKVSAHSCESIHPALAYLLM